MAFDQASLSLFEIRPRSSFLGLYLAKFLRNFADSIFARLDWSAEKTTAIPQSPHLPSFSPAGFDNNSSLKQVCNNYPAEIVGIRAERGDDLGADTRNC